MGLLGILLALAGLMYLSFRGWSILLLAPLAAMVAALAAAEPLLAHLTQTFMPAAAGFVAQFFPIFLLGALFGKLMEDSGSVAAIAAWMTARLGPRRVVLAVVLAGALVTYGGVSLFVAFFVIGPMAMTLFQRANLPRRLMPATIALGTTTFTMTAMPGTPAIQNAIPMPFFGTTAFAAPGLGLLASVIMLSFGLWWLGRATARAAARGEGFGHKVDLLPPNAQHLRERASTASGFDPAEAVNGHPTARMPPIAIAFLPLAVVIAVNLLMSMVILPRTETGFLASAEWGGVTLSAVGGVWSVVVALSAAILTLIACNRARLPALRATMDAGANAAVLPVLSVASLVGFGAVVAAMPAFALVQDWVLGIGGGPLVSLAVSTNILAALTGSASGGMTIALEALGQTYLELASQIGLDPGVLHRVAVIGAGTLDSLPHNGAVVTLLAVCGTSHKQAYGPLAMTAIVGPVLALVAVVAVATLTGGF
jgi:H+/gluconate symporter-like permease